MKSIAFRVVFAVVAIGMTAVWLSGCNTVQGVGQDVQSAGEALEDAAD